MDDTQMYIGSEMIVSVEQSEQKTPMGSDIVIVHFESRKKLMPKKTYELLASDIPTDFTIAHKTKMNALIPALKMVLCEYDVDVSEIATVCQTLGQGMGDNFDRATNFVWTGDDSQYIPGTNPMAPRSLLEADAIIRSIPKVVEAPVTPHEPAAE